MATSRLADYVAPPTPSFIGRRTWKVNVMQGLVTFGTLAEALRHGFQICDRTKTGYLVRVRTENGWALAAVEFDRE